MDTKLKVGLIDDEQAALDSLKEILSQFSEYELAFATKDSLEGLEKMEEGEADILILDVMMPHLGGLELAERLKNSEIPIILCSAYDKFAVSGYQIDSVYFVLKPAFYKEVAVGLKRAKERLEKNGISRPSLMDSFRIINSSGGVTGEVIHIDEIDYLEQTGNYTNIYSGKSKKVEVSSLRNAVKKFGPRNILQIHKSFAININKVKRIQYSEIILITGKSIPIGKVYRRKVDHFFGPSLF
ncbi:LytR/AlgR family response regulator transcription factor [Algoriphagus pacificus]|uniref:Response regulator transcription factor n=1 Tax=Algoriphagus pacificus TaxID=2811234 RepID=A0ABS3CII2_9BACT|nr:LytTR family DNA-binding domain-containing protein [Algoriphagus pacificus]MBN7816908.1 response regulator transcription factor [Algoriphagus pacificus]